MADPLAGFRALTNPDQDSVEKMAKLILDDDLSIVWGLFLSGTPKDMESIASIILKFFEQHERELYLMQQAITKEVQLTAASATLFRQNNFASKLLSCYSKRFGLAYIKNVLYDSIINVCLNHQNNPDWSCEIDERKLADDKKHLIERNYDHLRSISAEILQKILTTKDAVPPSFQALCIHLRHEAETKFPEEYPRTTFASVGGFIFLRFICPAAVVPHKYGLLEIAPGSHILRDLMMISKVLQTVANGVIFGKKEEYLLPLNDFVREYQPKVLHFLDELGQSSEPKKTRKQSAPDVSGNSVTEDSEVVVVRVRKRKAMVSGHRRSKSMDHCANITQEPRDSPLSPRKRNKGTKIPIIRNHPQLPEPEGNATSIDKTEKIPDAALKPKVDRKIGGSAIRAPSKKGNSAESGRPLSESYPPVTNPNEGKTNFDGHTFTYGELMGIIQYLTVYWQTMKPHLIKMDNKMGTKHTENYIQLSVLLEKLGVTSQNVVQQFSEINESKKKRKSRGPGLGNVFSRMRSPRGSK